ncbi:hypothetical protein BDV59DRAFT_202231 [Aspergillus ambiguus]|uniref:uncharacterized protein n=1 Tax=Aspergillus ambiguus TaxID=176160 RepID=UPI003CCCA2C6
MHQPLLMEDYPHHWKETLLGQDFWKDAEDFNQSINDQIEGVTYLDEADMTSTPRPRLHPDRTIKDNDHPVHIQSAFNKGDGLSLQGPSSVDTSLNETTFSKAHHRRFSMSDVLGLSTLPSLRGRTVDSSKHGRSRSRSSSVVSDVGRRSISLLRRPFHMFTGNKAKEDGNTDQSPSTDTEEATPDHPLMKFRGGMSWSCLSRCRHELGLDTFWPTVEQHSRDEDILPLEALAPLCEFRSLRVLKLTGMIQSYQKYIWQAAWLNTKLEELELEMVLPPRLRRSFSGKWPYIKGGWKLNPMHLGQPVYYGQFGDGNLSHHVGVGEYLDKLAIEKAKFRAMLMGGRTCNRLSIRKLTLTGFVVDADAFLHWFDPTRLKCVNFKNYCVDAGFYLSTPMRKVSILFPREIEEKLVVGRRVEPYSELKMVRLEKGKKVEEFQYPPGRSSKIGLIFMGQ